jgi:predicted ATPase
VKLRRRAFLIGPNASGKSNFLDAFRFLQDVAAIGGGFQDALRQRGGVSRVRCLAARRNPHIQIRICLGDDTEPNTWEYELEFTQDNRRRPQIVAEIVRRQGSEVIRRPDDKDDLDPERLTQTYLEQVNANQNFRSVSDFLSSIRYLHLVPQFVREPERSVGRVNDPFGGDFLEQVASATPRTLKSRLDTIQKALQVAVPQLKEIELSRDNRGVPHLRGNFQHWRPQGAWQSEGDFSDGTLRLMGLLWAILNGAGPLLLEEPELSLHPAIVRHIPQMFQGMQRRSGRQILTSTHSPDLLYDSGIGLDEVLLLEPGTEGTTVRPASDHEGIRDLVAGGAPLPESVMPYAAPANAQQLSVFGM